jgi:hypothetical protein
MQMEHAHLLSIFIVTIYFLVTCYLSWPGSSVGIATGYRLDGPGIDSQWRFSALVQTGPGAHQPPVQWVPNLSQG